MSDTLVLQQTPTPSDHAGGNEEVAAAFPGVEIVGPADGMEKTPIPALTKGVRDGDSFS